ncbi:MAG: hypothetical protein H0U10_16430, partial [Chloroflexia bacterium]|nr:hypothetical protein [Chloroflexia bacterium]
ADLDDLPDELREEMTFVLAETMDDVLGAAMPDDFRMTNRPPMAPTAADHVGLPEGQPVAAIH